MTLREALAKRRQERESTRQEPIASSPPISQPEPEQKPYLKPVPSRPIPSDLSAETAATQWLRERLSNGPRLIGDLVSEWTGGQYIQAKGWWEGGRDGNGGHSHAALMEAKNRLRVIVGTDKACHWTWALPPPLAACPTPAEEAWLHCPNCGKAVEIEGVEASKDGERMLTFWCCRPCERFAVTPNTIREPPRGWGTTREQ